MGTLVQSPEMLESQISNLSPVVKPVGGHHSLGTFLASIAAPVADELEKYDKASKDRVRALGRNDELNGVMYEVSLLDRRNYHAGHTYQKMLNGQIALAKKFMDEVNSADSAAFDPEELLQKGREFTNQSVMNIHDSDLPDDLKQELYDVQLKENATYMKVLDAKIKQVREDTGATVRMNSTAELTRNLNNSTWTVEEMVTNIDTFRQKRVAAARLADPERSLDDIHSEITADIKSAFDFTIASIADPQGNPVDLQKLEYLGQAADALVDYDLNAATTIQNKVNDLRSKVYTNTKSLREREVDEQIAAWKLDPESRSLDATKQYIAEILADESLEFDERQRLAAKLYTAYASAEAAVLKADVIENPTEYSIAQYDALGKSESQLVDDVKAYMLKQYGEPWLAGLNLMHHFMTANGEYSSKGVKAGSELLFREVMRYSRLTEAEVASNVNEASNKENFASMSKLYSEYKKDNVSTALDFISGVPDEFKDAIISVFESGGGLEDFRSMIRNPVSAKAVYESFDKSVNDPQGFAKELNLNSYITGSGYGGHLGNNLSTGLQDAYTFTVMTQAKTARNAFSTGVAPLSVKSVIAKMNSNGMLLPSTEKYSHAILSYEAAKKVNASGLGSRYVGRSIDAARETFAKTKGVDPKNVIVQSSQDGSEVIFDAYQSAGWRGQKEATLVGKGSHTMAKILKDAETLRKRDMQRTGGGGYAGSTDILSKVKVGSISGKDIATGRAYNASVSADYAAAFGGNRHLAAYWLNHMEKYEKFSSKQFTAADANSRRVSHNIGHGMTVPTIQKLNMVNEIAAASGDPQRLINAQGKFVRKYYPTKTIQAVTHAVGVPTPSTGMYPDKWVSSLMLLYDGLWHGGSVTDAKRNKNLVEAMNQGSYSAGLAKLKRLATYNRAAKAGASARNNWMEAALKDHYRARGLN